MRYWLLRISLLFSFAIILAGQTKEWRRYKNDDGNFSVLLPAEPKESVGSGQNGDRTHIIQVASGSIIYTVIYQNMRYEHAVNEALFKLYRHEVLGILSNCYVLTEDAPSPALLGFFGSRLRMNCRVGDKKESFVGNLYLGNHHSYSVFAIFPTATADPPTVKRFTDSFSQIDADR